MLLLCFTDDVAPFTYTTIQRPRRAPIIWTSPAGVLGGATLSEVEGTAAEAAAAAAAACMPVDGVRVGGR